MKKLIVAEKPSVAQNIARLVGASESHDGYREGDEYVVSWCVGHVVNLADTSEYGEHFRKWNLVDLPIIPEKFIYTTNPGTQKQFNVLKKLFTRDDISEIISATDAGREGESIFCRVYDLVGSKKPYKRLWTSSLEDSAILDALSNLRDGKDFRALYEAAEARAQADWMVGINLTRFYSILGGSTYNVGRVQTPTLHMIVKRDLERENFTSVPYYTLSVITDKAHFTTERIDDKAHAQTLLESLKGDTVEVLEYSETTQKENPPLLYDLTTLSRDANRLYGLSAAQTLKIAQGLYEKKLITYPRTDSRYLTCDMKKSTFEIIGMLRDIHHLSGEPQIFEKVFNDKKVQDHSALLPTKHALKTKQDDLSENEEIIFKLICARTLEISERPCQKCIRKALACSRNNPELKLTASQTTVIEQGFKKIAEILQIKNKDRSDEGEQDKEKLSPLVKGERFAVQEVELKEKQTKPQGAYTEDTLLKAMERAGTEALDKELETEKSGLGTPATRASIIEGLVKNGYVIRKKKSLISTEKARALIEVVDERIKNPQETAEWENKLTQISQFQLEVDTFDQEIKSYVNQVIVENSQQHLKAAASLQQSFGSCPKCGGAVVDKNKGYACLDGCGFIIWKKNYLLENNSKRLTEKLVRELLEKGSVELKGCKNKKSGKTFSCKLVFDKEYKLTFDFDNNER